MMQCTQPTDDDEWTRPLEEPPSRTSSADEVAAYVFDIVEGCALITGEEFARPLTTWEVKKFCEDNDHSWKQVSPLMRERRTSELAKRIEDPEIEVTASGVRVNRSLVTGLSDIGWLPQCPVALTTFSTDNFRHFTTGKDCRKWWCPRCGVERVEALLASVEDRIMGCETVYIAEVQHEPKLAARVRARRKEVPAAEYFSFRRIDGRVFFIATHPLGGGRSAAEPAVWRPFTPQAAMTWLKAEVIQVPSYHAHSWSNGWKPTAESADSRGPEQMPHKDEEENNDEEKRPPLLPSLPLFRSYSLTEPQAEVVKHGWLMMSNSGSELIWM